MCFGAQAMQKVKDIDRRKEAKREAKREARKDNSALSETGSSSSAQDGGSDLDTAPAQVGDSVVHLYRHPSPVARVSYQEVFEK